MRAALAAILAGVSIFAFGMTASAERGAPPLTGPAAACAEVGLTNYVMRGDTLYCYDYLGRGGTWMEVTYPPVLPGR